MKIWITGIAGFLGSHLRDSLLAEGHDVYGNDSLICGDLTNIQDTVNPGTGANMALADCRDFDRMQTLLADWKPDVLVHAAATAHEGLSTFSPSFITRNIYEASVATFSAAIAAGVKRIVYMSSMSRYGKGVHWGEYITIGNGLAQYSKPPFKENQHLPYPVDPYGIAKVAAEDTLKVLCGTHNVQWSIAVPHNIIGPRQRSVDPYRNVAAIMINRCKLGKPPVIYGDGTQTRCFSPVKDVLQSLVKMVNGAADGEVVNIGPDEGEMPIVTLANMIMTMTSFVGNPVYLPGRPNEVKDAYCCSDKARRLLGYEPVQSIDDCLREMVDYIQPREFEYTFPLEIVTDKIPKTWLERTM